MISKMAKVFKRNKAINHFLWPFLADFHKATPFQGKTQSKIKSIKGEPIPIPAFKFKNESIIVFSGGGERIRTSDTLTGIRDLQSRPFNQAPARLRFFCSYYTLNDCFFNRKSAQKGRSGFS